MMRRINKLKNVGRFRDLKSDSGTQGDFAKLNVIYARNACGKTTLCDLFRSLGTGKVDFIRGRKRLDATTPIDAEILFQGTPAQKAVYSPGGWQWNPHGATPRKILVYDDRFVADNVLVGHAIAVEQRRNLYGLALGERARLLKEAVESAEVELTAATAAVNAASTVLNIYVPSGMTVDTFRALPDNDAKEGLLLAANTELQAAILTKQNSSTIRDRRPLVVRHVGQIPDSLREVLAMRLDDAAVDAEKQIREHLQLHSRGLSIEWLAQGHRAQTGTACPHCGQDMDWLDIFAAYKAFFSGALQAQQDAVRRVQEDIEREVGSLAQERLAELLNSHVAEREWWRDAGGLDFDLPEHAGIDALQGDMEALRVAVTAAVQRKQSNPAEREYLNDTESAAVSRWAGSSGLLSLYMFGIETLNIRIKTRQEAASTVDLAPIERRITALKRQIQRHAPDVVAAYASLDEALRIKAAKRDAKVEANNALRIQSEQLLKAYGARINGLLECFGADFALVSGGVSFHGGPPAGELAIEILGRRVNTSLDDAKDPSRPSLANTLSGGDRSALALAFFAAVAEGDPELGETIVVFDDPFHSQDRNRRRRTIECLQRVASTCKQCFVLSHELDFARESAGMVGLEVKTFRLTSSSDDSCLTAGPFPPLPSRAYEQDYRKLTSYLRSPGEFADQHKDVARAVRQTLEAYLRTKFPESWREKEWLGEMIEKIRNAQPGNCLHCCVHLVTGLTQVNDWGKRYYHAETDGSAAGALDPVELRGYVQQTINLISS